MWTTGSPNNGFRNTRSVPALLQNQSLLCPSLVLVSCLFGGFLLLGCLWLRPLWYKRPVYNFPLRASVARFFEEEFFFGVVKTVLLANGHFAWLTPAIFVDFRGLRSKVPCFCGYPVDCSIRIFAIKTTCSRQGTKTPFSKMTVSTTCKP